MIAVIYTHLPDYLIAGTSARVLAAQGVRVFLAIEREAPAFACEFATVIRTNFDRRGNLNGRAFIAGHLKLLSSLADGDDYVLKVDSDTLVTDAARLVEGRTEHAVGVFATGMGGMQGCCYALRRESLPALCEAAGNLPAGRFLMEDRAIGELAGSLGPVHLPVWQRDANLYGRWNPAGGADWHRGRHAVVAFEAKPDADRWAIARSMKTFL
jgi:hypothetical protein